MEGQTKRSKCVCHPSNGHEGSSPPGRGSTLDSHGQGWPCGEWACKQATRDPYVPRLPPLPPAPVFYLYFIFLPLLSLSLHADEMSLNFLRLAYVGEGGREGGRDMRIVRYHIGKFVAGREFEIWLFISMEWNVVFLIPLCIYIFYIPL